MESNGLILWEGGSRINARPIIVIATGLSRQTSNPKTGDMIATWILDKELSPTEASQEKKDGSVCGECPLRRSLGGGCYVSLHQAPQSVWNAFQRGIYTRASWRDLNRFKGRVVRLGSYGDPAMVPIGVWDWILSYASGWTAYTHQWREDWAQPYRKLAMASVESEKDALLAFSKGWRTFRVTRDVERSRMVRPMFPMTEIVCPASEEAGFTQTCASCQACDGSGRGSRKASVAIAVHGALAMRF